MHPAIEVLQQRDIPISSYISAVQHINNRGELTHKEYIERIKELTGEVVSFTNDFMYRFTYLYLIQNTVKTSFRTDKLDMKEILNSSISEATTLLENNPWFCYVPEKEPVLDANGKPKPKKGAKKEMAKQVWDKYKDDGVDRTRKEWIQLLVDEVGLTPLGASTYYANLKKGKL